MLYIFKGDNDERVAVKLSLFEGMYYVHMYIAILIIAACTYVCNYVHTYVRK